MGNRCIELRGSGWTMPTRQIPDSRPCEVVIGENLGNLLE